MEIRILGILINDRVKEAGLTQKILTTYSDIIRSRLGFHEVTEAVCSRTGVVILQLAGDPKRWDSLEEELGKIGGVEVQTMRFI